MYAAVSYLAPTAKEPALGTSRWKRPRSVAVDDRLVNIADLKILETNFPTIPREQVKIVAEEIVASLPVNERVIALDRVLANMDSSLVKPKNVEGVKADPPTIFFSKTPAVLVNIDGEPIWAPIPQNDLKSAVNTNWDLFEHSPTTTYYLRHDRIWLKASAVKGPWSPAGTLPESFKKLPDDENWKDVKSSLPGQKVSGSQVPKVFVSYEPAEMILLRGEPSYVSVSGATPLLWVNNTDSDVFRMSRTGAVYFLVSGRWFSAPDFVGPWTFASQALPAEFKQIPVEHERSRVLASVPGSPQALEAVLLAQIPQTARVSKKGVQAPEVVYQGGKPEFQPIEKTTVQRAVNTDKDIIKVGDVYYMCFQGVWFMSTTPEGPWQVTGEVPKQIYEIPVSSPAHNVTYVTVEDDDDDAVVFATAMAYTGMMVAWGCVVWGSGYYYPPYYGFYGGYPYYYPHYPSYGYGASYNPWTGAYGRHAVAYGPYGGAGVGQRYNPRTGTYSRGAVAWGPYGARGAASGLQPAHRCGRRDATGIERVRQLGPDRRGARRQLGHDIPRDQQRHRQYHPRDPGERWRHRGQPESGSPGGRTTVGVSGSGDVYAGHDGNVYRKQGDSWQKYGDGGWSGVEATDAQRQQAQDRAAQGRSEPRAGTTASGWDSNTASQVDRDSRARAEGSTRTRDQGNYRSSGGSSTRSSGSYRGGGGGARAGGGGRRR